MSTLFRIFPESFFQKYLLFYTKKKIFPGIADFNVPESKKSFPQTLTKRDNGGILFLQRNGAVYAGFFSGRRSGGVEVRIFRR